MEVLKNVSGIVFIMDNFTSCEEHFEYLKSFIKVLNISTEYQTYNYSNNGFWESQDIIRCTKIIAYIIIIIGGLLGNLSVIMTVALIKSVRNAMNFYVANLALADLMICMICMLPHVLIVYTRGKFVLGSFMCKFSPFTQTTCLTSSVLTLCAISRDRFLAVFRPFEVRTTEKRTCVIIVLIWIISMAVSSPLFIVKNLVIMQWADFTEAFCSEDWPVLFYRDENTDTCQSRLYLREIYHVILPTILFFIPVLIMFGAYSTILYKLWTSKIPGEQNEANLKAKLRSKQKVLKMVIVVLIVFVICWTPLQVLFLLQAFGIDLPDHVSTWLIEFEWFSYYIAYANSFINPFIYGQYNKDFRKGFYFILCCRQKRRKLTRFWGENMFTKSLRSLSTTISTLRSTTQAFIARRISKSNDLELPETAV